MRFLRHSLTGLFLMSLTLGLLVYAGQIIVAAVGERLASEPEIPERREREFAVNIVTARTETIAPILTTYGEVQSRRTLELRAKTTGTVVELADNFVEGGSVGAGQLLARIDPTPAQFALDRAKSELVDAEAEQNDAARAMLLAKDDLESAREQKTLLEKAFQRQLDLETRGVGTAAAVEVAELSAAQARQAVVARRQAAANAEARVNQAETRLARARIALSEAERALEDTKITADFSGTLSEVSVVKGRLVSANEQLARLIDGDSLEVSFRVSTPQYARLIDATGDLLKAPVTATLEAFGLELPAKGVISRASAAVEEGTTGRLIFARLYEAPAMKPGDFVTVTIEEPPLDSVIRLPASALGPDQSVLVVNEDDRLAEMPVTLLRRQGQDVLVRGSGLAGRDVVAERAPLLGGGIKVRPIRPGAAPPPDSAELLELTDDRRARLQAFVRTLDSLPEAVRSRLLAQLDQPKVPARVVERLERRMGG